MDKLFGLIGQIAAKIVSEGITDVQRGIYVSHMVELSRIISDAERQTATTVSGRIDNVNRLHKEWYDSLHNDDDHGGGM